MSTLNIEAIMLHVVFVHYLVFFMAKLKYLQAYLEDKMIDYVSYYNVK